MLIVGAGPTGLVLAAELLARGVSTRIIDRADGTVLQSRAIGVHARTLEVLDVMGLAERLLERGHAVRHFRFYSNGRPLTEIDLSRNGSRFGFVLHVPQHVTESLLRARVAELGGTIDQGVELVAFQQDRAAVTATVQDRAGGTRTITADFLAGCDGAHSRVRHELGLAFQGHPYPDDVLLADVRLDWDRRRDAVHFFTRSDGRPLIGLPMPEDAWRLVMPSAGERARRTPTLEEIQELVDERAPEHVTVTDPVWLASFRTHRRSADTYRRGRVLLAGDALHIHPPAGGQGMNTGMTDAHNLAWKLALVVSGRSDDWLLDTYGAERRPVAAQVIRLTHTMVQLGAIRHPLRRVARDALLPAASRLPAVSRQAARRLGQIHVAYPGSGLTRPGGGRGGPRPGGRAPDIPVSGRSGPTRLYEVLRGRRHVLVISGPGATTVVQESVPLRPYRDDLAVVEGEFGRRIRVLHRREDRVVLVRPDGYIAVCGRLGEMGSVLDYLRQLFPAGEPATERGSGAVPVLTASRASRRPGWRAASRSAE